MEISVHHRLYNSYGGQRSISLAADFLEYDIPDFGSAIGELEITLYFKQDGPAKKSLERMHQEFHENLSDLPKCTFFRKKRNLSLDVEATFTTGYEIARQKKPPIQINHEWVSSTLSVIVESLPLLRAKIEKSDDFNFDEFQKYVTNKAQTVPSTIEELEEIQRAVSGRRKSAYEKLDEWEKLGIDWDEFHPASRELVTFPYQWNISDEFAPNGNDTGADTLEIFREWNQSNPDTSALTFLVSLLRGWNVDIDNPYKDDYSSDTYFQAVVGLAFASAKIRGECEEKLKELSVSAIERYLESISNIDNWEHKEECKNKISQSRLTIQEMPNKRMQTDRPTAGR